jgi:hypothetical protein
VRKVVELQAQILMLESRTAWTERVLLDDNSVIASARICRRFDVHLLRALALELLYLVHQTPDGLWPIELQHELLGGVGPRRCPIGATRTCVLVHHVLDGMSWVFGRVVDCGNTGEVERSRVVVRLGRLAQPSLP